MKSTHQPIYSTVWRNKFLTVDAESIKEMADALERAAVELRAMQEAGVELVDGVEDDYALLATTDPAVAKKFGLEEESGEEE